MFFGSNNIPIMIICFLDINHDICFKYSIQNPYHDHPTKPMVSNGFFHVIFDPSARCDLSDTALLAAETCRKHSVSWLAWNLLDWSKKKRIAFARKIGNSPVQMLSVLQHMSNLAGSIQGPTISIGPESPAESQLRGTLQVLLAALGKETHGAGDRNINSYLLKWGLPRPHQLKFGDVLTNPVNVYPLNSQFFWLKNHYLLFKKIWVKNLFLVNDPTNLWLNHVKSCKIMLSHIKSC